MTSAMVYIALPSTEWEKDTIASVVIPDPVPITSLNPFTQDATSRIVAP